MNEHNTYFTKIYISLFLERVDIGISVRETQRQRDQRHRHRLAEVCYIDPFLTHIVIPCSGPYIFASLVRGSQPGYTRATA